MTSVKKNTKAKPLASKKISFSAAKKKAASSFATETKTPRAAGTDVKKEVIEELLERGRKHNLLSYEEVIEFSDKNHMNEQETNELLRVIEKEHIELVMQDELDGDASGELDAFAGEEDPARAHLKAKLETSLDLHTDEFDEDETEGEELDDDEEDKGAVREAGASQITDPVKCYLRDIGKIPLFNKKTETAIADQIAKSKIESIDAISRFPFIHKEFVIIGERLAKEQPSFKRYYSVF